MATSLRSISATCRSSPKLGAELARLPLDQMMILAHGDRAKAYTPESFGKLVPRAMHRGRSAALLGAWAQEGRRAASGRGRGIRIRGHGVFSPTAPHKRQAAMSAKANRATLTTSGLAKLSTNPEQKLSNLPRRLGQIGHLSR